jgi:hypothetical protein
MLPPAPVPIEVRLRRDHGIPGRVIGDDFDKCAKASLVRFADQRRQIGVGPMIGLSHSTLMPRCWNRPSCAGAPASVPAAEKSLGNISYMTPSRSQSGLLRARSDAAAACAACPGPVPGSGTQPKQHAASDRRQPMRHRD